MWFTQEDIFPVKKKNVLIYASIVWTYGLETGQMLPPRE